MPIRHVTRVLKSMKKMGRPPVENKKLKLSFTISQRASEILNAKIPEGMKSKFVSYILSRISDKDIERFFKQD